MAVKHQPSGYQTVIPYLMVNNIEGEIKFLTRVFHAEVIEEIADSNGSLWHAEVRIGDSVIMMGRNRDGQPGNSNMIYIYTPNTDEAYNNAIAAGATSVMEPADQFYGDRNAGVVDAEGHTWWIATHVEDITPEELAKRAATKYSN